MLLLASLAPDSRTERMDSWHFIGFLLLLCQKKKKALLCIVKR